MSPSTWARFDPRRVPSPCFVLDEAALATNLALLDEIQRGADAKILLALKAFAAPALAPQLMATLAGTAASGLYEARLGREAFGGEVHTFGVAFAERDFDAIAALSDHVVFNSPSQWRRFGERARRAGVACGLRVNPGAGAAPKPLYDPCRPGSRLGTPPEALAGFDPAGLDGVHLHALCEQDLGPLEHAVAALEARFGALLAQARWLNLGGGHRLTDPDYDRAGLVRLLRRLAERHDVALYLEPGEAVVRDAGVLVTEVLDVIASDGPIAIVDASATCHAPDVIEAGYTPELLGAGPSGEGAFDCRVGGPTCLAGDVFGAYGLPGPPTVGDRLVFLDQAPYTIVKTNSFNGMPLPAIAVWNSRTDALRIVREFGYADYAGRLG